MSISYKQLNNDISDIINNANNRKNTIDYINEYRSKIAAYYKNNINDIDIDVLLKMHKKLINDNKVINDNLAAVFFGLLGSLIFKLIEDFGLDDKKMETVSINPRYNPIIILVAFVIVMFAVAFAFSKLLDYFNNKVYNYKSLYIDEWHANFIKEEYLRDMFSGSCIEENNKIICDSDENTEIGTTNKPLSNEEMLKNFKRKNKFLFSYIHRPLFYAKRIFAGLIIFKFRKEICKQHQLLQLREARNESNNLETEIRETVNSEIDRLQEMITGKNDKKNESGNKAKNRKYK